MKNVSESRNICKGKSIEIVSWLERRVLKLSEWLVWTLLGRSRSFGASGTAGRRPASVAPELRLCTVTVLGVSLTPIISASVQTLCSKPEFDARRKLLCLLYILPKNSKA
jgi:hypothetical protein